MRVLIKSLLFTIIVTLFVSCTREAEEPIRIGINGWPGYEFLFLAEKKGFFEDEGVEVDIVEFNSLADGRRAYERGQIDGLGCTLVEHLQILNSSKRSPQICIVADYSDGADVVIAIDKIKNIAELKGKKIGIEIDSLGTFMLARMLDHAGLELSDLILKPMDQFSIEKAMCLGELDAAITYPPFSVNIEEQCDSSMIFSSADIPREIVDIIIMEKGILEKWPEKAAAISRAFFRAQQWTYENSKEAFSIMGERENLSAEDFQIALTDGLQVVKEADQKFFFAEEGALHKALESCKQILIDTNQISSSVDSSDSIHYIGTSI